MRVGFSTILTPLLDAASAVRHITSLVDSENLLIEVLCERPALELETSGLEQISALKSAAAETGVELSLHAPCFDINPASSNKGARKEALRQYLKSLEVASRLEASSVVVHTGMKSSGVIPAEEAMEVSLSLLGVCASKAASLGVKLLVENTGFGYWQFLREPKDFLCYVMEIPGAHVLLDFGHAACMGWNLVEATRLLMSAESRFCEVHYHDNMSIDDDHLVPGYGCLPLGEALTALGEGWNGNVVVEVFHPDAGQAIELSLTAIRESMTWK